jgi:hypothetical protein
MMCGVCVCGLYYVCSGKATVHITLPTKAAGMPLNPCKGYALACALILYCMCLWANSFHKVCCLAVSATTGVCLHTVASCNATSIYMQHACCCLSQLSWAITPSFKLNLIKPTSWGKVHPHCHTRALFMSQLLLFLTLCCIAQGGQQPHHLVRAAHQLH